MLLLLKRANNLNEGTFFFRANKLLGGKLGWIHLQHTRFLKASSPVLFHRFRGALTGHAINRLSDTWNNYLKLNVQRLADSRQPTFGDATIGFSREKTSEKQAQKFHTDDASLPRSG